MFRTIFVIIPLVFVVLWIGAVRNESITAEAEILPRLWVSENQRFLVTEDGKPFFWLGDTAWELFHRLDRAEAEL